MKTYQLWWVSEDRQGSIDGGKFSTEAAAWDDVENFNDFLLSQCRDENEIRDIEAGIFEVEETKE